MLTCRPRRAKNYRTPDGKSPFEDWFKTLKDVVGKARVAARIERAEKGNFGNYRELGEGVFELKESFGPGYRVYFGLDGNELIILLIGGSKNSQTKDIAKAKVHWADYKETKK